MTNVAAYALDHLLLSILKTNESNTSEPLPGTVQVLGSESHYSKWSCSLLAYTRLSDKACVHNCFEDFLEAVEYRQDKTRAEHSSSSAGAH